METTVRWVNGTAVLTFPREVDVSTADGMREQLLSALNKGASTLVIDMSQTTFCDSSGLNAVIRAHHRATASGAQVRVVIGSPAVRRVFEITKLDHTVAIHASLDEALGGAPITPPESGSAA